MASAGRPTGPDKPLKKARDAINEREEIDETLSDEEQAAMPVPRSPSREQPSPQPGNEAVPDDLPPAGGEQQGRR
ncbi:MAG: hypothetical protein ACLGHY_00555 [Gammaproteobacteria bacterium]